MRKKKTKPGGKEVLLCSYGLEPNQVTLETLLALQSSDKVFLAGLDADCAGLLKSRLPDMEIISRRPQPEQIKAIARALDRVSQVAVVTYGEPSFFCSMAEKLSELCRATGAKLKILPAISSFNALLHLLGLNLFRASGLYICGINSRMTWPLPLNPAVPALIFQPDDLLRKSRRGLKEKLVAEIKKRYPPEAKIVLAEAPCVGNPEGRLLEFEIREIGKIFSRITANTTLYLPREDKTSYARGISSFWNKGGG